MPHAIDCIHGTCQQLLFSPEGGIEGLLMKVDGKVCQVTVDEEVGALLAHTKLPGTRLRLLVAPDRSSETAAMARHTVYRFVSFADAKGQQLDMPGDQNDHTTVKGVVSRMHYALHGEANGVVLETGEFIHTRPDGMALLGLEVGAKVQATGALRMTVLGTVLLEAHEVNHVALA